MTTFSTRIGLRGEWPRVPQYWSYSTLNEVESCPLRYALRHATYEGLDDVSGYPEKYSEAALGGIVVHAAIERVMHALQQAGTSARDEESVAALRSLGGYSQVIDECISRVERQMLENPRMKARASILALALRRRATELRASVQSLVTRLPDAPQGSTQRFSAEPRRSASSRGPLGIGRHAEARLVADSVRLKGQIDLLTVRMDRADIVDFKTGQAVASHADQMMMYGILWRLDRVANPDSLPVGDMTLVYASGDVDVSHPDSWTAEQHALVLRVESADKSIAAEPEPILSEDCSACSVRHMCDEYWRSDLPSVARGRFIDAEVDILSRNGPKSWWGRMARSGERVLVRTPTEESGLASNATVRLMDVGYEVEVGDSHDEISVLTAVGATECFSLLDVVRPA